MPILSTRLTNPIHLPVDGEAELMNEIVMEGT